MWSIHVGSNVQILEKELSEREQEVGGQEKEDKGSFNVSLYDITCCPSWKRPEASWASLPVQRGLPLSAFYCLELY